MHRDLKRRHGDEEAVTGGTASGKKPRLESLQIESSKGHGGREPRAMDESLRRIESGKRRRYWRRVREEAAINHAS
jgi:hypothetical protein